VKYGLAQGNTIADNRSYGVSIGHRDTENLIVENEVVRSGKVGVLFRPERGKDFAPHRNRVERNRILDSGPESGAAVDVQGQTQEVAIVGNEIRESRGPAQRVGVRLGKATKEIKLAENHFAGLMKDVEDLRN